ncbi:MAG: VWA domain-containing protein [Prevotella sp.]|nr:VWA domain-containing protein [Prevotella sp.]
MEFAQKEYFFLLLLLIPYIVWYLLYRKKSEPTMRMSDTFAYRYAHKSLRVRLLGLPNLLRAIVFILLVIILARPQTFNSWGKRTVEGIDIMLALDVSTSMLAEDLKPNRIEAAKSVATQFISDRADDNIGLTIFAGEAFTQCPMTTDHTSLINLLQNVPSNIAATGLLEDGTAIGMGIVNAISRLRDSQAKSKVIILLTDGVNNRGDISPLTAANMAKSMGMRVYTIAIGSSTVAPYPVNVAGGVRYVNMKADVDTKTLKEIASIADGKFYHAENNSELRNVYKDIDQLEKTRMETKKFTKRYEAFQMFALAAAILMLLEILLRITLFRRIP